MMLLVLLCSYTPHCLPLTPAFGITLTQEAEQAVLSNISNAFLAKRRLLARELATARIQEKLSLLEEKVWELQHSMAQLDTTKLKTAKYVAGCAFLSGRLKTTPLF